MVQTTDNQAGKSQNNQDKDQGNQVQHQQLAEDKPFKGSGKHTNELTQPIVSWNKTSEDQSLNVGNKAEGRKKPSVFENAIPTLSEEIERGHPFYNLKAGQGMFFEVEPHTTTDKLMLDLHKKVDELNQKCSVVAVDKDGNDILEELVINIKQTNEDGTYKIRENGSAVYESMSERWPKRVYFRKFVAIPVTKGQKVGEREVSGDGGLVIRVF